jgi:DNA-binding phage protein
MKQRKPKGRAKPFREYLDRHLEDPEYAREYLLAAVEEGLDIQIALADVLRAVGATRYQQWVKGVDRPNLLRAVRKGSNPTLRTIEKLLRPLRLRLSVTG